MEKLAEDLSITGVIVPATGKRRRNNVPKRLSGGLQPAKSTSSVSSAESAGDGSRKRPLETTVVTSGTATGMVENSLETSHNGD